MRKKNKIILFSIILAVLIMVILCFAFYKNKSFDNRETFGNHEDSTTPSFDRMSDVSFTDKEKSSIEEFFNSAPSESEVEKYCNENRIYCMYYCTELNLESDYCENITFPQRRDMPKDFENRTPPEDMPLPIK